MHRNFIAGSSKWAGGHDNPKVPAKINTGIPRSAAFPHVCAEAYQSHFSSAPRNYLERKILNLATTLPFRFKAGGDSKMPSAVMNHSHRATTKVNNKAFKSRKATKGSLRDQAKGM